MAPVDPRGRCHWLAVAILSFALSQGAAAQDVGALQGRVTDLESGRGVAGAVVSVVDGGSVVTDSTGAYRLSGVRAGVRSVRVERIGYGEQAHEVLVTSGGTATLDVALAVTALALQGLSVVGQTEAQVEMQEVRQSPFSVSVIDASGLTGRGLTLDDAIQRVTGMQVRRSGGLGSASLFHVRGLEGKRIQVYIDGNAANISGDSFTLDAIPMALVQRIEVYKGAVPARFGGDGLGAAINVVLIDPPGGYEDASYTVGSFGQHQISTVYLRPLGPDLDIGVSANFDFAANDYRMNSPFVPGLEIDRDHDRFRRMLVGTVLRYHGGWFDELHAEAALITTGQEIQGIQTNIQHAETNSRLGVVVLDGERLGALDGRLDLDFALVALGTKAALVDTSSVRYTFDGSAYPSPNGRGELAGLPAHSDNRRWYFRNRGAATYRFAPAHVGNLTYTVDHSRYAPRDTLANRYAGGNVSEFPGRQTNIVLGLSHEWRPLGERFINIVGTRAYGFLSEGTPSNPWDPDAERPPPIKSRTLSFGASNAVRYFLTPELLGKGSVELARRLPESIELFGDGLLLQPAPTLRPERSLNLNVGLQYERGRPGQGHLQAEVNGFWMSLHDMIALGQGGRAGTASYTNLGQARIAGFDVELKGDVTPWLYASAGFTYQDARDAQEIRPGTSVESPTYGLRLPNMPWLYGIGAVEAHAADLMGNRQESRVFLETSFTDEYFYAFEMSRNQERRIPRALSHTLGIEHQWLDHGVTFSAEVQNLTDAQVINQFRQPLPGRTLRLKLRYTRIRDIPEPN